MSNKLNTVTKQHLTSLSGQSFSMNDLNDPPRWNIRPEPAGDDGSRWNYALLVPMIGLAAFRKDALHTFTKSYTLTNVLNDCVIILHYTIKSTL